MTSTPKVCSVDGCPRKAHGRGWCPRHYNNWYYRGGHLNDPPPRKGQPGRPAVPIPQRFWSKVDFSNPDGCWLWAGARRHAYGEFWVDGHHEYAHRVAFSLVHGSETEGFVLHRCDTPLCVRPDHLYEGNQADNMADCAERQRWRNQHAAGAGAE